MRTRTLIAAFTALVCLDGSLWGLSSLPSGKASSGSAAFRASSSKRVAIPARKAHAGESDTLRAAGGLPDLVPFRPTNPSNWSSPLVIATRSGTNREGGPFTSADTLFIDWAVINDGNAPIPGRFFTAILLDGVEVGAWFTDPPLNPDFFTFVEDFTLGPLNPGTYTIQLVADVDGDLAESNEFNNTLTRQITVQSAGPPNLTPFQPQGWSGRLVLSTQTGTNVASDVLTSSDEIFLDWAVINNGGEPVDSQFFTALFVDGEEVMSWFSDPPLDVFFFSFVEDFSLGNLSAGPHTLRLVTDTNNAIAESNEGDNEFTLNIVVQGDGSEDPEVDILFGAVQSGGGVDTGVALANPTDEPASIDVFLFDDDGSLIQGPGILNPVRRDLAPNGQIAETLPELFGANAAQARGWIRASSANLGVVGFFLTFVEDVSNIDGAKAVTRGSVSAVFPEILSGPGEASELNFISAGAVDFELIRADGSLAETQTLQLPNNFLGRARVDPANLFSAPLAEDSYVVARSREGFVSFGYQSFSSDRFIGGINALNASPVARDLPASLFGAQLAEVGDILETNLTLINPNNASASLELSAFRTGEPNPAEASVQVVLGPGEMLKGNARTILGLPAGDFVGWLRADSDMTGVVGNVTFGDPQRSFLATVELQANPDTEFVFSHLADGLGFSTGVTFLNTGPEATEVTVEVFNRDAQMTGTGSFTLQSNEHRPRTLSEIIPGFQPQVGGTIRVRSESAIFAFELFSFLPQGQLLSLAAVPPQKGTGTVSGSISLAQAAGQSASGGYRASRSKGIELGLEHDFVPGEAVVRWRAGRSAQGLARLAGKRNVALRLAGAGREQLLREATIGTPGLQAWRSLTAGQRSRLKQRTLDWIDELNRDPDVLFAEPNYLYQAFRVPNDTRYPEQWHYSFVNFEGAWDITVGSADVIAAVLDTGARFDHPDLGPRLTGGQFDFVSDPARSLDGDGLDGDATDPGDDPAGFGSSFHGTHVAGTLGAVTDNGQGVAGVNWVSPLMTLRVLGASGSGTTFDIAQAVLYAAGLPNASGGTPADRAHVINMSLGGPGRSQVLADAVADALAEGVAIVAAAGNERTATPMFPASLDGVVSVGATDLSGGLAPYSNFGTRIDVVASGGNVTQDRNGDQRPDGVLSTLWNEAGNAPRFEFYEGTSMASPHVAGLVSLMLSVNDGLSPAQVRSILQNTAIDLGANGRDDLFGFGLINPVAALQAAGAAGPNDPILSVSSSSLDFGALRTQQGVVVINAGSGTLQVDPPTVEVDQAQGWLAAALDGNLVEVLVNRDQLNQGEFTGRIRLTSNGGNATIEVRVLVGEGGGPNPGALIVLAIDPITFDSAGAAMVDPQDLSFQLPPIESGEYLIVAGSDEDGDFLICEPNELCGFYPISSQPTRVRVESNQATQNIDFSISREQPDALSGTGLTIPKGGFRVPRRPPGF